MKNEINIKMTHEKTESGSGLSYIYVQKNVKIAKTVPYHPEEGQEGPMVNLDLAENGSLIGIEILLADIK